MKTLLTILLVLTTHVSIPNTIKNIKEVDFDGEYHRALLYQILWIEARGEGTIGLSMVLDVIRNRLNHPDFPSTLDSVLLQPNQFSTIKSNPTSHFKRLVDTLLTRPIQHQYLFFINPKKLKKKPKWVKRKKKWFVYGNHSFAI